MPESTVIRILIVDDHPIVRMGLESLIGRQSDLEVCGQASGLSQALTFVDTVNPDVAVVDISLQDGDGIDLIRRIRARNPRIQVHPAEARAVCEVVKTRLSDEFVSAFVDGQYLQLKELLVAEPVRLSLHRLDLVVRPLHGTRRDHHIEVGQ
jgi:CheY-like chemotaxis protein